ncbi:hypothetical protein LAZ67_17001199 [Cordylochernes scorpioides]|uniref:Reverse transcriptase Ty1/copia-type domain-containing protein n=1 Tax=Cordylochernes scorpioides TaxID=51811 RepID=A0ABY6LDC1_9ARAC|nr:hypothetical protein LAZ67_17001199 [Cordylochernes scorpioides]
MIFALTINKNWYNRHLDVDNAYMYGELNEEIYMSPPDGSNDEKCEGKVLKLNRPIYGLRQSGLEWYCTLDKALEDIGFRRLAACNYLYTFEDKAVIAVYVDDLALFTESEGILTNIEEKIREKFKIKNLGPIKYFLGVEISYPDENTIILSQGKYTMSILERFNMMECRGVSTPLDNSIPITKKDCPTTDKEKDEIKHVPYRELIGSLLYLANSSRPDMTFAVTKLAQFFSNPGERHWQAAKHILRYIQATKNVSLIYKRGSDDILAFSDSDWANDIDDRRSISGSAVTINGCLVSWRSKKQNCVSLSTMESEYIALAQTTKEILWIAQILENLKCLTNASRPITIFCDNRAAIEFSKNNIENNRSKHIDIRYHYIREKVNSGDIHVNYISTNDNLADIFTKGLKRTAHQNAYYTPSDFPLWVKRCIAGLRILSVLFADDRPRIFKTDGWTCEICGTRMEPVLHHHLLSCMGMKDEREVLLSEIGLEGLSLELLLNEVTKNTNELLEICKKLDLFENNYQERVEKSKALLNGPRSPRPRHQEQWKNAPSFKRPYQNTSKPQAPAPRYYQNTPKLQAPAPRYYQNKPLPQIQTGITNPYPRPLKILKNQTLCFGSQPAEVNLMEESEQKEHEEPQYQINENLSYKEKEQLKQVLEKYADLFSSGLGRSNLAKHRIDTEGAKPIKHKSYRTILESFPVILVKKRDGKYRFCVDCRKLNDVTVKDVYPIPRIDEVLDTLQGSKYFSAIDLKSGY